MTKEELERLSKVLGRAIQTRHLLLVYTIPDMADIQEDEQIVELRQLQTIIAREYMAVKEATE